MRARTLATVAGVVGGALELPAGADAARQVQGVSIDSRTLARGELFFALAGDRADGHDFVGDAARAGAAASVVASDRAIASAVPLIRVADPARALLDLATDERTGAEAAAVGITGSTGKTCTKDFAASVLATRLRVVRSPASFNNEIGLPLTVLDAPEDAEVLVLEMGARGRGHVKLLCDVARPRVGVVTNVGVAHMELFGSAEAIRDAKAELPEALPADGVAVLNADDPIVRAYAERTAARVLLFGASGVGDVRAERVATDGRSGHASFVLRTPLGEHPITLPVAGEHMVANALAAAAVGHAFGLGPDAIVDGLSSARMSSGRMQVFETADGVRVIDDAYNANPTSMAAALKAARTMAGDGRCIAVLGGMAELGPIAAGEHARVGELLVRLGIDRLIAVGVEAEPIAVAAEREGIEPERIVRCSDVEVAVDALASIVRPGDLVLIKASRAAGLDRIARAISGDDQGPEVVGT
jgi:UDP-N-acetylmuramoyl-tripeptide--D-alanyl-D-alanine ligase